MVIISAEGQRRAIIINKLQDEDYAKLNKKRYLFNWKMLKNKAQIYKLQITEDEDILGVLAVCDFPEEKRMEIKLLACSVENIGKHKTYEGIAGCLIAYACRLARRKYGYWACVSLLPKTILKQHYIQKYEMIDAGWQLYLEGDSLNEVIKKYVA